MTGVNTPIPAPDTLITNLRDVLVGPLTEIGQRFSALLTDLVPHTALVIFTRNAPAGPARWPATRRSSTA